MPCCRGSPGWASASSRAAPRTRERLPADELAAHARRWFAVVEALDDPREALVLAHSLGEPVLVTGSLYLLADLEGAA